MQSIQHAVPNDSTPVVRWSAVLAGAVVAMGVLAALYALGVSTGMAAFDVNVAGRARHVGLFVGVWGAVAPFIALFAGGYVAGRGAGTVSKSVGFLHGLTMWGVSAVALMWLTYSTITAAASGVMTVGKGVAQAGGSIVQAGGSALAEGFDGMSNLEDLAKQARDQVQKHVQLDADTVLKPVNAKLKEAGRKPLSPDQIERAVRRIGKEAVEKKKLDRAMVMQAVTEETSITRQDAETVADAAVEQYNKARAEMDERIEEGKKKYEEARAQATEKLEKAANETADAASKAFAALFIALAIGLAAAGGGATLAAVGKNQ